MQTTSQVAVATSTAAGVDEPAGGIPAPINVDATAAYAHLFQALAEPTRLAILQHLAEGEHRVRDLVEHMGLAQSTVSKHVAFLAECGLLVARPEGRSVWYALAQPELLRILINAAERMLGATGNAHVLADHLRQAPEQAADAQAGGE